MTPITDMALPLEVKVAAANSYAKHGSWDLAIRAALQAMCDCGMAKVAHLECRAASPELGG